MIRVTNGAVALADKVTPKSKPPMSMREVARQVGVSVTAVSAWCQGISIPTEENQKKLAKLLGIPVSSWGVAQVSPASARAR